LILLSNVLHRPSLILYNWDGLLSTLGNKLTFLNAGKQLTAVQILIKQH